MCSVYAGVQYVLIRQHVGSLETCAICSEHSAPIRMYAMTVTCVQKRPQFIEHAELLEPI